MPVFLSLTVTGRGAPSITKLPEPKTDSNIRPVEALFRKFVLDGQIFGKKEFKLAVANHAREGNWGEVHSLFDSKKACISLTSNYIAEHGKSIYDHVSSATGKEKPCEDDWKMFFAGAVYRYHGSTNNAAKAYGASAEAVRSHQKGKYSTPEKIIKAGEEIAEATRKPDSELTAVERTILGDYKSGKEMTPFQMNVLHSIYKSPGSWQNKDFEAGGHQCLIELEFDDKIYNAVSFFFLPGQEIFRCEPKEAHFLKACESRGINASKWLPFLDALHRDYGFCELEGGFRAISRNGAWELHRKIQPGDMAVHAPHLYKNKLLFTSESTGAQAEKFSLFMGGLSKDESDATARLKGGGNLYLKNSDGEHFHVTRKNGALVVHSDKREAIIQKVLELEAKKGLALPCDMDRSLFKREAISILEAFDSIVFLVAKLVHPELQLDDMRFPGKFQPEELQKRALKIYPDWFDWFAHRYQGRAKSGDWLAFKDAPLPQRDLSKKAIAKRRYERRKRLDLNKPLTDEQKEAAANRQRERRAQKQKETGPKKAKEVPWYMRNAKFLDKSKAKKGTGGNGADGKPAEAPAQLPKNESLPHEPNLSLDYGMIEKILSGEMQFNRAPVLPSSKKQKTKSSQPQPKQVSEQKQQMQPQGTRQKSNGNPIPQHKPKRTGIELFRAAQEKARQLPAPQKQDLAQSRAEQESAAEKCRRAVSLVRELCARRSNMHLSDEEFAIAWNYKNDMGMYLGDRDVMRLRREGKLELNPSNASILQKAHCVGKYSEILAHFGSFEAALEAVYPYAKKPGNNGNGRAVDPREAYSGLLGSNFKIA